MHMSMRKFLRFEQPSVLELDKGRMLGSGNQKPHARKLLLPQTVRHMYGDFGKVDVVFRSGALFHKRLLFCFIIKV